jgi:hypothetical protein
LYTTKSPVGVNFEVYNHLNGVYNYIMNIVLRISGPRGIQHHEFRNVLFTCVHTYASGAKALTIVPDDCIGNAVLEVEADEKLFIEQH